MRIVVYNKKKFTEKDVTFRIKGLIILFFCFLSLFTIWSFTLPADVVEKIPQETKMLVLREENSFSEEKLIEYIKTFHLKFPHIIMAQAKVESGDFKSRIFKENWNLFGMRVPKGRPSTNKGLQYNHAKFETWKDCVIDYVLYVSAYLKDIKNEEEYYRYLGSNYAEDPGYVKKIRKVANSYRSLFSAK